MNRGCPGRGNGQCTTGMASGRLATPPWASPALHLYRCCPGVAYWLAVIAINPDGGPQAAQ
jgi:hypothetical protein